MAKNTAATASVAAPSEAPAPTLTPLAAAQKAIAGKTQDELLALYGAGKLNGPGYGDAELWRAYMLRIGARQDRKAAKSE